MTVTNVMAISLDGAIAAHDGETDGARQQAGFTSEADRQHLLSLLAQADAVVVGGASVVASGGILEHPGPSGRYPIWVVLSSRGLPDSHPFWRQERAERWLVSPAPLTLPNHRGKIRNLVVAEANQPETILQELAQVGRAGQVLLFGGGRVNREFYSRGLVDRLIVTVCPIILASLQSVPLVAPDLIAPVRLTLVASQPCGDLVFLTYNVLNR